MMPCCCVCYHSSEKKTSVLPSWDNPLDDLPHACLSGYASSLKSLSVASQLLEKTSTWLVAAEHCKNSKLCNLEPSIFVLFVKIISSLLK